MDQFLQLSLSFPTIVFTVLLLIAVGYWLIAAVGLVGHDLLHFDLGGDHGHVGEVGAMAGLLMKFGLDGVPLTFIFTAIVWIAWMLSYLVNMLVLQYMPLDALRYAFGAGVVVLVPVIAVPLAGVLLYPLKSLFAKIQPVTSESLLGRSAIVRSPEVTLQQGSATLDDGGAGLILMVRAEPGLFRRGDTVVLVEYIEAQNAYKVIAESAKPP